MTRKTMIALLVALVLVAPVAVAEDDDEDDDVDRVKRELKLDVSPDKAKIALEREGEGTEDSVEFLYEPQDGMMKVSYETENETSEIESELTVRFTEVIEFRDADGTGAYDRDDEVVARHAVKDLSWKLVGPEDVTTAGVAGKRLTGIGDFAGGGAMVIVLYAYGDFATMNGTSLLPSQVKIDIILDQFPFEADDTLAAVLVRSEQETEIEIEVEGDAEGVVAEAQGLAASFTWADVATVDGVETPVKTTVLRTKIDDDGTERSFAFAYTRGEFVNHDPVLGIQSAGDARDVPALPLVGGLVAVAAVAIIGRGRGRA